MASPASKGHCKSQLSSLLLEARQSFLEQRKAEIRLAVKTGDFRASLFWGLRVTVYLGT